MLFIFYIFSSISSSSSSNSSSSSVVVVVVVEVVVVVVVKLKAVAVSVIEAAAVKKIDRYILFLQNDLPTQDLWTVRRRAPEPVIGPEMTCPVPDAVSTPVCAETTVWCFTTPSQCPFRRG
ncbi:LOW QUALITY PROTEIN: hypothetical protein ElyMa_000735100 [Elysia marginata]|uniref:Secreted protein n=1 Tax=Elysia marginata TaxID=1093978 RepID=A0AAV4GPA1_9GAST|nr:LOW QUALITY PROTEIN: hypothetical protein ElyMa_000735100 [Elysia marginata]